MIERRPWSCPRCAHFVTRPPDDDHPTHDCPVAGEPVALVDYVDANQHAALVNQVQAHTQVAQR